MKLRNGHLDTNVSRSLSDRGKGTFHPTHFSEKPTEIKSTSSVLIPCTI
ncbi:MAG: hypothetical protein KBH06_01440 [Spirochaetes bacterium]|nr:hypothetical protein [Spirochaetota bacterium]